MAVISLYSEAAPHRTAASQAPFEIQNDNADGETLADRYQMLEELGSGSFGVVYKAIEKDTGEIVAIKHVDLESSEEDLSDILSELSVLSSCSSPHVTKYRLAFLRRQTLWIVMEYLGGGSCADLLKPPPHRLSENHIAIVCRELLMGLAYLHSEGKLHRDIKAANVLLGMDGRVKLADFGVAAQLVGLKSVRNTFVGTPFWMAPEVIQQEGHDAKADVWSLGITAMELANGEPPHANVHPMKVLFLIPKQPAPRLEGGGHWSKDFRDFVACCLTKDVDRRPSAKELLKHRFIRSAGKVEGLQELIVRKQDWEAQKGGDRNLKYYAETMKNLSSLREDDDWVFETVKAVPTMHTQKRRKVSRSKSNNTADVVPEQQSTTKMLENMSLGQEQQQSPTTLTMRKVPAEARGAERKSSAECSPSLGRRTARKRVSSQNQNHVRQPLGVNISFGNSPSTVRQFKRVSSYGNGPSSLNISGDGDGDGDENEDPNSSVIRTPSKKPGLGVFVGVDMENSLLRDKEKETEEEKGDPSRFSSTASTTVGMESKEAQLGRKLYANAIGISCQEVLSDTADEVKREAVARLAEAFSDLENVDPDGMYHVMRRVLERMRRDDTLRMLLPQAPQAAAASQDRRQSENRQVVNDRAGTGTGAREKEKENDNDNEMENETRWSQRSASVSTPRQTSEVVAVQANASRQVTPSTPRAQSQAQAQAQAAQKLVLAQNNPHLKSHRRRQSAQVQVGGKQGSGSGSGSRSRETSSGSAFVLNGANSNSNSSPLKNNHTQGQGEGEGEREKEKEEEKEKEKEKERDMMIDLVGGLEHTRQLADVLFERWCEGLRVRWPAV
ncbi:hypothetical protein LTR41_003202 [Exophiala xenobiotica]|nr:hypothetical protein LTR41_003202 [Exophiala xenobiotica]